MKVSAAKDLRNAVGQTGVSPIAWVIAALSLVPVVSLLFLAFGDTGEVWGHLLTNVLPRSIATTATLMAGVAACVAVVGIGTAWLVSRYEFPGRALAHWMLVLPLAIPTYISAYCFVEFLGYTGPLQTLVRGIGGFKSPSQYWFPEVRSLPGAVFVLSVVLYPYVYLTCRLLFEVQGRAVIEAGRMLGANGYRLFREVALPLARPAVAAGIALALLETLNDIGAVEILGVRTLTFSIFDTWLNRSSLAGAAQIACLLLVVSGLLLHLERRSRGGRGYAMKQAGFVAPSRIRLVGARAFYAAIACAIPPLLGFIIPVLVMLRFAISRADQIMQPQLQQAAINSILVASITAIATTVAALAFLVALRSMRGTVARLVQQSATLGYAIPGSVLAIGMLFALTRFDNFLDMLMRQQFGLSTGLLLSGSAFIVVYACSVRFFTIAHSALDAGHQRLSGREAKAGRTLGRTATQAFFLIELPLLKGAILTSMLLVFVETMKELSATIFLRPFNFPTLATHVYELSSRARFEDAAIAALFIVGLGAIPVVLLSRLNQRDEREKK